MSSRPLLPLALALGAAGVVTLTTLSVETVRAAEMPAGHPAVISAADAQFFETRIRPILADKCYQCHSREADKIRGGLLLDTREGWQAGGNSDQPALVPGNPEASLLIKAISYQDDDLQMPPKQKLSDAQIADLTEWVRRGAPDPRTVVPKGSAPGYGGVGKDHWAFKPVQKPAVPAVKNAAWPVNPIDNFVLAKLEANDMTPNAPAEKATLIRRVYFDLVGLPPSVRDVQAFVNDKSPDAYEKVVDRLLASPYYGEHAARYWLDVARYSDSKGDPKGQEDARYPHAWTYRDWVIGAFNGDMPYNEFILEQIAGDRVQAVMEQNAQKSKQPPPESRRAMAGLGFLTLGNQFDGRRPDIIADQIDVTTKAFLGLTVACARCHDHKFDPIPTKDFYSLYGVFANTQIPAELPTLIVKSEPTADFTDYTAKSAELAAKLADAQTRLREWGKTKDRDRAARQLIVNDIQRTQREIGDLESTHPGAPPRVNALTDVAPRALKDYPVLLRGEVGNAGEVVPRRFLEVLSPDPKKRPVWTAGSGRAQLAMAIADPKNPLTARVIVNRIWQQHWGEGFVATPDDLGNMSSPPTHPELLDWLAATFVEQGWSIKQLHRKIVLSAAYRQSSATNAKFAEADPNNKLLWRYNLRRMTFEQMHDSLLAITGEIDPTMGGRPVAISSEEFAQRRAIYTLIDRRNPPELLTQFDFPSPDVASGRRYQTLVPQQALFLMNSPMVIETARKLVDRPAFAELKSDRDRVTALYLAIYQRLPTAQEVDLGAAYVNANPTGTAVALGASTAPAPAPATKAKTPLERKEERQAAKAAANPKKQQAQNRFSTQVGGVHENKNPLDAWTKLAHALFQSNEAIFYE